MPTTSKKSLSTDRAFLKPQNTRGQEWYNRRRYK